MADLKTMTEEREEWRTALAEGDGGIAGQICAAALDDVDTLLAENAKLRSGIGVAPCIKCADVVQVMHRRAQKAEGELAKIGGEPGGLAYLRNEHYRRGDVDIENAKLRAENARLRAAEAEGERLRALAAEARDMLRAMPWRRGGDALVARLDRAALGEP